MRATVAVLLCLALGGCGKSATMGKRLAGAPQTTGGWWLPTLDSSWDWQLAVPVDTTTVASVYEIDLFDNDVDVIAALHDKGRAVLCYTSMGAWESWRPDAATFPAALRGAVYKGFTDERWLDVRQLDALRPIIKARFDQALQKGCDGIEADNVDGYDTSAHESSGFPLVYADQLAFNRLLAHEAHARGMAIALKNDINQAADLQPDFDCAVSEECFSYGECDFLKPFTMAGKAIFEAEYALDPSQFCADAKARHIGAIEKHQNLDAWRAGCP